MSQQIYFTHLINLNIFKAFLLLSIYVTNFANCKFSTWNSIVHSLWCNYLNKICLQTFTHSLQQQYFSPCFDFNFQKWQFVLVLVRDLIESLPMIIWQTRILPGTDTTNVGSGSFTRLKTFQLTRLFHLLLHLSPNTLYPLCSFLKTISRWSDWDWFVNRVGHLRKNNCWNTWASFLKRSGPGSEAIVNWW